MRRAILGWKSNGAELHREGGIMKRFYELLLTLASFVAGVCLATVVWAQTVVPASKTKGKVHILPATMETTQWGWYDNAQKPVLTVKSGDTVIMETMMHFHDQFM